MGTTKSKKPKRIKRLKPLPDLDARDWSIEEASVWLQLAESSVRSLIAKGELGHMRVGPNGGRIRITLDDCRAYLERCRVAPKEKREAPALPKLKPKRLLESDESVLEWAKSQRPPKPVR
jgi:excisionase family DNA binding protein